MFCRFVPQFVHLHRISHQDEQDRVKLGDDKARNGQLVHGQQSIPSSVTPMQQDLSSVSRSHAESIHWSCLIERGDKLKMKQSVNVRTSPVVLASFVFLLCMSLYNLIIYLLFG